MAHSSSTAPDSLHQLAQNQLGKMWRGVAFLEQCLEDIGEQYSARPASPHLALYEPTGAVWPGDGMLLPPGGSQGSDSSNTTDIGCSSNATAVAGANSGWLTAAIAAASPAASRCGHSLEAECSAMEGGHP